MSVNSKQITPDLEKKSCLQDLEFLPMTLEYAVYLRKSTSAQNFSTQRKNVFSFIEKKRHKVAQVVKETGSAWKNVDQPKLWKLIKETTSNIIVNSIDRFSRNLEEAIKMIETMHKKGLKIVSLENGGDEINSDSDYFKFLECVRHAEYESDNKSKRAKNSAEIKRNRKIKKEYGSDIWDFQRVDRPSGPIPLHNHNTRLKLAYCSD